MLFRKIKNTNIFNPAHYIKKKSVTSGGSRSIFFLKNDLPLQITHKNLVYKPKWYSGRNKSGRIVLRTRKSLKKRLRKFIVNYSFRYLYLGFIASMVMIPFKNKLLSLLFLSSGSVNYVVTSITHDLFKLVKLTTIFKFSKRIKRVKYIADPISIIDQHFFLIIQLPKNKQISLLEILPKRGTQYIRSSGTYGLIVKMDTRINTSVVKLPSGVRKVFSIYSTGSKGSVALPEKKHLKNNKAGFYKNFGKRSKVRGVAMNPIDHPHGGRTKAIKYQRTPWGKTTKFK